jgi:Tfp pilus assembly protein PilF
MPQYKSLNAALLLALLLSGCSLPKIIVLHDPLSADEHVRLGGIYDAQGKTELARDQYQAAVRQDTKHGTAWALLGDTAVRLKDYPESAKAYKKALILDPQNGDLHNNLAWVYVQQDENLQEAHDLVTRALQLIPAHRPYYLDTLGVVLLKLGKVQEAVTTLKESVDTLPRDQPDNLAEAYQHLADAYQAAGDIPASDNALERQRQLKQATQKEPALQP